jgi:prepilin-type N-terminal cleavage/methylation domain-containing protein
MMKMKSEKGTSLIEVLVALALLGLIGVSFLSATATTSTVRATADERDSAKILAEDLMEDFKKQDYASSYNFTIPDEFDGYSANLTVTNMKNENIQDISVTIIHHGHQVLTLESYKTNR